MTVEPIEPVSPSGREHLYQLAGFALSSSIPLPELEPAADVLPSWRFNVDIGTNTCGSDCEWFHEWKGPSGEPSLLMGRMGPAHILYFPGLAIFRVSLERFEIKCTPQGGLPRKTLRHLLLDQVFPLILSGYARIVLHASAVLTPRGAIVFAASSGAGKSTLAAYLSLTGYPLLTDDCLLIEECPDGLVGTALYTGTRLWPDSFSSLFPANTGKSNVTHYSDKIRVPKTHLKIRSALRSGSPITGIYFLSQLPNGAPAPVTIDTISSREAFLQLMQYSFVLDMKNPHVLRNQFMCLQSAASRPLFRRISFIRDYAALPEIRNAIEEDVQLLDRYAS